jgi:hypothetical protein
MKRITAVLTFWILLFVQQSALAQFTIPFATGANKAAAPSLPVFADYPTCGFSTSCTDTVAAGDLVVMMGSAIVQGNITSYAVSSSPSATWNCLPLLGGSSELCWAIMSSSGSTTFTMTPTPSATYATIQIMHYTGGTGHTVQTSASATGTNTTGTFSTTTPTLTIVCAAGGSGTFTAGTVGGHAATNFYAGSIGYNACEDYTTSSSLTSATAVINSTGTISQIQAVSFQ